MDLIFIDTNIYLRFYDSNKPELKKLLSTINELSDRIFITVQVVDEVDRNKLAIAQASISEHEKNAGMRDVNLPEQFDSPFDDARRAWNRARKDLLAQEKELIKSLQELGRLSLEEISISLDEVSAVLNPIFAMASKPTDEQLERARLRKELGNPPGKNADPLGDQLSWEQLLDSISRVDRLWIISNDHDYFTAYAGECHLNPLLNRNLKDRMKATSKVYCFNGLAEGLRHFNQYSKTKLSTLPTDTELDSIASREILVDAQYDKEKLSLLGKGICPTCRTSGGLKGDWLAQRNSFHIIYTYSCARCGTSFETDEVYLDEFAD